MDTKGTQGEINEIISTLCADLERPDLVSTAMELSDTQPPENWEGTHYKHPHFAAAAVYASSQIHLPRLTQRAIIKHLSVPGQSRQTRRNQLTYAYKNFKTDSDFHEAIIAGITQRMELPDTLTRKVIAELETHSMNTNQSLIPVFAGYYFKIAQDNGHDISKQSLSFVVDASPASIRRHVKETVTGDADR